MVLQVLAVPLSVYEISEIATITNIISSWQTLAPGNLPTKHLDLMFADFNPKIELVSFNFVGFVDMIQLTEASTRPDLVDIAYYRDSYSAQQHPSLTGQNYYGSLFFIQIGTDSIEFEDYGLRNEECQATSMKLLRYLSDELGLEFSWRVYS